jgi:transcriptional regulator with XRE-family HTH domain
MIFAAYIRQKRSELGLTQAQLANLIDVDKQSVSNWECGRNEPWAKEVARIEARLGAARTGRQRIIDRILSDD